MTTNKRPNEPSEAQVEAAAKVLADYEWVSWAVVPDHIKVMYRAQARAALEAAARAAQGAAPEPSSTVDEDALAEVIADAVQHTVSDYAVSEAIPVARAVIASRAEWLKG